MVEKKDLNLFLQIHYKMKAQFWFKALDHNISSRAVGAMGNFYYQYIRVI